MSTSYLTASGWVDITDELTWASGTWNFKYAWYLPSLHMVQFGGRYESGTNNQVLVTFPERYCPIDNVVLPGVASNTASGAYQTEYCHNTLHSNGEYNLVLSSTSYNKRIVFSGLFPCKT